MLNPTKKQCGLALDALHKTKLEFKTKNLMGFPVFTLIENEITKLVKLRKSL